MKTDFAQQLMAAIIGVVFTAEIYAQTTAFTYQGELRENGQPANGSYEMVYSLHDAEVGGNQVGVFLTNTPVLVSAGLFTVTLDFGSRVFTGADRWLAIGVRTNGSGAFAPLSPRQPLTPAPYALYAPDAGAATTADSAVSVAVDGVTSVSLQDSAVTTEKIADGTVTAADLSPAVLTNTFWRLGGNAGTLAGSHFMGTTDDQPLELRVRGGRVLRLEPTGDGTDPDSISDGAPNVIVGSPGNFVKAGVIGATISGGGATNYYDYPSTNGVSSDYGTVGGGAANRVGAYASFATVAGGERNDANGRWSAIGGGWDNNIESGYATIGGGILNRINPSSSFSAVGGGFTNWVFAIAGVIGGGFSNRVSGDYGVVGGGRANHAGSFQSTISGGEYNLVTDRSPNCSIGGGRWNEIDGADSATIGGGVGNGINGADSATIAGGDGNSISARANDSAIAGGRANHISPDSTNSVIGGGFWNEIGWDSTHCTIGGGSFNAIDDDANYATIPGGFRNTAASYAFAAGRRAKANHNGAFVWADSQDADFASERANQLRIRADGGVSIAAGSAGLDPAACKIQCTTSDGVGLHVVQTSSDATAILVNNGIGDLLKGYGSAGRVWFVDNAGNVEANSFSGAGGGLTALNASQLTSGTLPSGRLAGTYSSALTFNSAANSFTGNGSGLTSLNASQLNSGTVPDARLSATVARLNSSATFNGTVTAGGDLAGNRLKVGSGHTLSGSWGTIPGGLNNTATSYAFAAGRRAKAVHTGAFVWADATDADYASTGNNQFCIRASGGVHFSPDTSLHCGSQLRQMLNLYGTAYGLGVQNNTFYSRSTNQFCWFRNGVHSYTQGDAGAGGTRVMTLDGGGNLFTAGGMYPSSDRNVKTNFATIEPQAVLARVVDMPIQEWSYRSEGTVRHIGPVAQDFRAAFGLGKDDKHIATVDADGVALAAIQGLNQKVEASIEESEARGRKLEAENAELKRELAQLKQLVNSLTRQWNGSAE